MAPTHADTGAVMATDRFGFVEGENVVTLEDMSAPGEEGKAYLMPCNDILELSPELSGDCDRAVFDSSPSRGGGAALNYLHSGLFTQAQYCYRFGARAWTTVASTLESHTAPREL